MTSTTYVLFPSLTVTLPVASSGKITLMVPLPWSITSIWVSCLDTANIVAFSEGRYLLSPLYITLTEYSPLGSPLITSSPFPPLTATMYSLPSTYTAPNAPLFKLNVNSSEFIITVTFPVASVGTIKWMFSFSPTCIFETVGITNEGSLDTLTVVLFELERYLSSPRYVKLTL